MFKIIAASVGLMTMDLNTIRRLGETLNVVHAHHIVHLNFYISFLLYFFFSRCRPTFFKC